MNFEQSPLLVIWEVTQACDLACAHCRNDVQSARDAEELTTEQGFRLLEQIKTFGNPLVVFTGGDPLKRPDLLELMRHSVSINLRTNITPSATANLTPDIVDRFRELGIARMAINLDGPDAASHDALRHTEGTFERGMAALLRAKEIGLETQIHTTVTASNHTELGRIAERVFETGGKMWSLFFMAGGGPLAADGALSPAQFEKVFQVIYELSKVAPFDIKTTEAAHYRRFVMQQERFSPASGRRVSWKSPSVGDGRGFIFISHRGEIYPSGFLPVSSGNVVRDSIVDVYRHSKLFMELRDAKTREGRCGRCEFQFLCGGSRARAFAATGNYLAEDPGCEYEPVPVLKPAPLRQSTSAGPS
jgi:radical SAM protein